MYLPVKLTHPFLNVAEEDLGEPYWKPSPLDKLYQPETGDWPLYWLKVNTQENGFSFDICYKAAMDDWWTPCNAFEPIPFEFVGAITEMLETAFCNHYGERP